MERLRNFGLPESERLKGKQVIKEIFSRGKRFKQGNLTIVYLFTEEPKAGFVASKKIGGAVKRNKVKRILREAYRMNKEIFKEFKVIFYADGPLTHKNVVATFRTFKGGR